MGLLMSMPGMDCMDWPWGGGDGACAGAPGVGPLMSMPGMGAMG